MSNSALALHELSFVPEAGEVVVGRVETGQYVVLPEDGAELLRRMSEGMSPAEAARWYEARFGEPVDVADFVETLHDLGFVRDEHALPAAVARPLRLRRLGRAVFSPPAWLLQLAILAVWFAVVARHHDLLPAPSQIFFTGSLLTVQLVITFAQVPLLFLHEGYHIMAGQRLGLPSRLRVSNRLTYIVFETQLNGALSVPRRKRYLPFLAGMFCDCVQIAVLVLVAELNRRPDGSIALAGRICLAMSFTVVMRLAWQFQLYLRTDLYYVFATALNCYDLHDASKALLWNRIWRALRRPDRVVDDQRWTEHDRRVGNWYGPFIVLGVCTMLAITVLGSLPVMVQYFGTAAHHLTSGSLDGRFWDSALSLAINAAQVTALVWLSRRKRRAAAAASSRTPFDRREPLT